VFKKVLIANRGAIACRVIRTLHCMGIESVAVYSDADRHSLHVRQASEAARLGPAPAAQSYLDVDAVLDAARKTGAAAIHPGYGFLSENADFAEACEAAGIAFIGPTPAQIRDFGLKHRARELAAQCGVAMLPGTGLLARPEDAAAVGFPLMLKSTAGGGGIGMRVCASQAELDESFASIQRLSQANFKESGIYAERFVERARHVEVQVFGDGRGRVVALGERDCSAQRRNQKVIEETPAPGLLPSIRQALLDAAVKLCRTVSYRNAGTVEFIFDGDRNEFYFLEVNTRLQVEHGVTEEVTGVDLVEWMVRLAAGDDPIRDAPARGAAIQVRIYAESPLKNFQPCAGLLTHVQFPDDARVETWVETGTEIPSYYDPLLAKIIVRGETREDAVKKLDAALSATKLGGIETNVDYLRAVCADPRFRAGGFPTALLRNLHYQPRVIEVIEPGTQSTVQDYPGRLGYWSVGVPPSGPMDWKAFILANRIVGNEDSAAAFEFTLIGPVLKFHHDAVIALTGADMGATIDGVPVPRWQPTPVRGGTVLELGSVQGPGARGYLAVRGGLRVEEYLGSKSTFILGKFGGQGGRFLRGGDLLAFHADAPHESCELNAPPTYTNRWEIGVTYGPHGAPDFFTDADITTFFATDWKVHYNSDRTGVRLIGPKPEWARKDGGEAGLHPSNIHDNAYAVGAIDFTGDMPIILGPDGPSCGGFVCPAVIIHGELWKIGQLKAGDTVRFLRVNEEPAVLRRARGVAVRQDGDRNLLVEFGENHLDFGLRLRAHALMTWLQTRRLPGIVDLTPGVRSLQIHYDTSKLSRDALLEAIDAAHDSLECVDEVPSRIVHLPLSWDDPATRLAIQKYMTTVRADAPWCPWNIEFIRRINGLDSIDDLYRIVYGASYLTLALGDVYLGAPVATPIDPRHRLVTTKYNPARTWTPENAVGIGGAYMCVYGMEGPGGYQFVGRTVQMWNTWRTTHDFHESKPWLLDFFDQIRFYPVTGQELLELREGFPHGEFSLRVEPAVFRLSEYQAFSASIREEASAFTNRQQAAFVAERDRWAAAGIMENMPEARASAPVADGLPEGCRAVRSPVAASVWKVQSEVGQRIAAGDPLLILEAMKMEVAVVAPSPGEIVEIRCVPGAIVESGQTLVVMR
jgi:urea carboxylase